MRLNFHDRLVEIVKLETAKDDRASTYIFPSNFTKTSKKRDGTKEREKGILREKKLSMMVHERVWGCGVSSTLPMPLCGVVHVDAETTRFVPCKIAVRRQTSFRERSPVPCVDRAAPTDSYHSIPSPAPVPAFPPTRRWCSNHRGRSNHDTLPPAGKMESRTRS